MDLRVDGPYRILADGQRVLAEGQRLAASQVAAVEAAAGAGGLRIGDRTFSEQRLQIDAGESGTLWVEQRRYRGGLKLLRNSDVQVLAINLVDVEQYVASVLNGEMPGTFPAAARRAQAIVSRSYALFQMQAAGGKEFDVYDSARSQVYQGIEMLDSQGRLRAVENDDSRRVAAETRGVVLLDRGRSFCPFFGAVAGGTSGQGPVWRTAPPLCGVTCGFCGDAPRYRWQIELPRETVLARLAAYLERTGRRVGEIESFRCEDRGDGRLPNVNIRGRRGTATISTATLKGEVLAGDSLPSPFFSVSFERANAGSFDRAHPGGDGGERLVIRGRGWGYGVGLCQWESTGGWHLPAAIRRPFWPIIIPAARCRR